MVIPDMDVDVDLYSGLIAIIGETKIIHSHHNSERLIRHRDHYTSLEGLRERNDL